MTDSFDRSNDRLFYSVIAMTGSYGQKQSARTGRTSLKVLFPFPFTSMCGLPVLTDCLPAVHGPARWQAGFTQKEPGFAMTAIIKVDYNSLQNLK